MNRSQIIAKVACPVCHAPVGQPCKRRGKVRKTVHPARVQYATGGKKITAYELMQVRNGKSKRASSHIKKTSDAFYASWEWKQLRFKAFEMHGRQCMCCGWSPSQDSKGHLCVDHIKPRSKHPKLALDINNLQVLCNSCNMGKSNTHETDFRAEWHGEDEPDEDPLSAQFRGIMQ